MKNKLLKKKIAMILIITMLFCLGNPVNGNAQTNLIKKFQSGDAVISFTLQSQWDSGYVTEVAIQNKGDKPIKNWKLEAKIKGTIDNIWNATQESHEELTVISNEGWNCNIEAGESITFGMKVEGASFDDIVQIVLKQGKEQLHSDGYAVEYNITQQWGDYAIVDVVIHNTAQKTITNWNLTFQLDGEIVNIWNADIKSENQNQYIIQHKSYNAVIKPDSTVSFGMEIQYANTQFNLPDNETLKSYELSEETNGDNSDNKQDKDDLEIDWNDKTDTDNDGLPDVFEDNRYYTDKNNSDTDGDGLEDGYEVEIGTDPTMPDTDEDGLDDGEEINHYKTNPLENDTDKDGLMDGDEIVLNLNPLIPDTDGNGILDGEEYINQSIDKENIDSDLYEDNDAVLSYIKLKARGNINRDTDIVEYEGCLRHDDPAIIGKPILLEDMEMESGEIQFALSAEYEIPEYQINGTYTNGLLICYNDNKEGDTIPLETKYDNKTKTLTSKISQNGIYFVLDTVEMFNGLGIDLESTVNQATRSKVAARSASNTQNADTVPEAPINGKADIIFVVDTTISMDYYIVNVKYNLNAFVEELNKFDVAASFALVEFKDITVDGKDSTNIKKYGNACWTSNINKFKKKVDKLEIEGGGDFPETPIDALETARRMKKHESAKKYIILVTDEKYKNDNRYGIKDMDEMINLLCQDEVTVSVVSHEYRKDDYKSLYQKTGGKFAAVNQNFAENLLGIAGGVIKETNNGYWIGLKGLTTELVKLEERPTLAGTADKDKDGLLDNEELIITSKSYVDTKKYQVALKQANGVGKKIPVYDYLSHPGRKDTDLDEIPDKDDSAPRKKGIYSAKEKKVVVGEMTIVSCTNGVGHSFLVYRSYVKDKLNFKKFAAGYKYKNKTWEFQEPCEYLIMPQEYVSLGNAGEAADGSGTDAIEKKDDVNDGDKAGSYYNREFAKEHLEGKAIYDKNWAYKREISEKQLKSVIKVFKDKNYYNIATNNCTKVAIAAWNKAYPDKKFLSSATPDGLKKQISGLFGRFTFNMAKEVPNIR